MTTPVGGVFTIDNAGEVYVNGFNLANITSWFTPVLASVPANAVVAVHGINADSVAGIFVDFGGRVSDATWRCTVSAPPANWTSVDFDDSAWAQVRDEAMLAVPVYFSIPVLACLRAYVLACLCACVLACCL